MEFFIDAVYKKYDNHIYIKLSFPLIFLILYLLYYYTMISTVYNLSDALAEKINPYAAMPYITGVCMLFISLMYDGMLLKAIYMVMFGFSVSFSFLTLLKNTGNVRIVDYFPYVFILLINFCICAAFEKYKNKL